MSIKIWMAARLQAAFRKERKAWRIVPPRPVVNTRVTMPFWAVDDRRHMDFLIHDEVKVIPDFVVQKHSFDTEYEAVEFISRVCWIAAVTHLLRFWEKEPL